MGLRRPSPGRRAGEVEQQCAAGVQRLLDADRPALLLQLLVLQPRPVGHLDPRLVRRPLHQLRAVERGGVRVVETRLRAEDVPVAGLRERLPDEVLGGAATRGGHRDRRAGVHGRALRRGTGRR